MDDALYNNLLAAVPDKEMLVRHLIKSIKQTEYPNLFPLFILVEHIALRETLLWPHKVLDMIEEAVK